MNRFSRVDVVMYKTSEPGGKDTVAFIVDEIIPRT